MTDALFPDKWLYDRRFAHLSDADDRAFSKALLWSVFNRTDGVIEYSDIALIPYCTEASAAALVKAGLWSECDDGWLIVDFMETQTYTGPDD